MTGKELNIMIERIIKRKLNELSGLDKQFDKAISDYKTLELKMQQAKTTFINAFRTETDPNKKEKLKTAHLDNIKKLNKELSSAEVAYDKAITNLATADEDELL